MRDINWSNFKAKFNQREGPKLEELAYHLFLREFDQPSAGIFGYKNQTGIETEPVEINGEKVGFQAKYSDAGVPTVAIKNSLTKAKTKNPDLNRVVVYTNQEFGGGKKSKEPRAQTEVEAHATDLGLAIGWRLHKNFEALLARPENDDLAEYFFCLHPGRYEFINELKIRTKQILDPIRNRIEHSGRAIKFDRTELIDKLRSPTSSPMIAVLSGPGGSGKTAAVRDFFQALDEDAPFFVLRASQFNVRDINELFVPQGGRDLTYFLEAFSKADEKYIVVDSAERLGDFDHQEAFGDFLTSVTAGGWKVIITVRDAFLDLLTFQLTETYRQSFQPVRLENLSDKELQALSSEHGFEIPTSERLRKLIANPFHLAEYLRFNATGDAKVVYEEFRRMLWKRKIASTSTTDSIDRRREKSFLKLARLRAESGTLLVSDPDPDHQALQDLEIDEVIGYDEKAGGYFITHDVYEEWALEVTIDRAFAGATSPEHFFGNIGDTLPMRRAFRHWLSEKLISDRNACARFIENTFTNMSIPNHWRDEVVVSALLSDYAAVFFELFEEELLENDSERLIRVLFLLRLVCKEIDPARAALIGRSKDGPDVAPELLIIKPNGAGWNAAIAFLQRNIGRIEPEHLEIILPVLEEWTTWNKTGDTTRNAGLITLHYYEVAVGDRFGYRFEKLVDRLSAVINHSAAEISPEIEAIFDGIIDGGSLKYREKHHRFVKNILSNYFAGFGIAAALPVKMMKVAEIYWLLEPNEDFGSRYSRLPELEERFSLEFLLGTEYFPASAFQTPMLHWLRYAPAEAIDFLLSFSEKTIGAFVKSNFDEDIEEIELIVDGQPVRQYANSRLWNLFRGTSVAPNLLESMYMALESHLLEVGAVIDPQVTVEICKRLIRESKYVTTTALVASLVAKFPEKLFPVAEILFGTKDTFLYDTERKLSDASAGSLYSIPSIGGADPFQKFYVEERMKTCDDKHRKWSLEEIARNYQFFGSAETADFGKRQERIYEILDSHYAALPEASDQNEDDKTWRIYLARMDSRKMITSVEDAQEGDGKVILFNPTLSPELREFSETSLAGVNAYMQHVPLKLWCKARLDRREADYAQVEKYETDPLEALRDARAILEELSSLTAHQRYWNFNREVPSNACAVLLRDFADRLSDADREFCGDVIIDYAGSAVLNDKYDYQIGDGSQASVISLGLVMKHCPKLRVEVKRLIIFGLLNETALLSMAAKASVLNDLWTDAPGDAKALIAAYLDLKEKARELRDTMRREEWNRMGKAANPPDIRSFQARFEDEHAADVAKAVANEITFADLGPLEKKPLPDLANAFELVPLGTGDPDLKSLAAVLSIRLADSKAVESEDQYFRFSMKPRILTRFARFVLSSTEDEAIELIRPFVDQFNGRQDTVDLLSAFVYAEDALNKYETFWAIWKAIYPKAVELCRKCTYFDHPEAWLHSYLFANFDWTGTSWLSIKERERAFFRKAARDMGSHPSAFYSLCKFLNDIGSSFADDGIDWLSEILRKGETPAREQPEVNAVYYLEKFVRRYVDLKLTKIRNTPRLKEDLVVILDFLVEKGSVVGYMLRDRVI